MLTLLFVPAPCRQRNLIVPNLKEAVVPILASGLGRGLGIDEAYLFSISQDLERGAVRRKGVLKLSQNPSVHDSGFSCMRSAYCIL